MFLHTAVAGETTMGFETMLRDPIRSLKTDLFWRVFPNLIIKSHLIIIYKVSSPDGILTFSVLFSAFYAIICIQFLTIELNSIFKMGQYL